MDYTVTHAHLDQQRLDAQQEADLNAWLDSLPEPEFPPTCGQCTHHRDKCTVTGYTGATVEVPAHCIIRAIAELPKVWIEPSDPYAVDCPFFEADCPF